MEWIYLAQHRVTGCYEHDNEHSVAVNDRSFLSEEILTSHDVMELHEGSRKFCVFCKSSIPPVSPIILPFLVRSQNCEKRLLASSCLSVCLSICPSVLPHKTDRLPLGRFSSDLLFLKYQSR
jgi:hypothetical protein